MKKLLILTAILSLWSVSVCLAQNDDATSGLYFSSHEVIQDKRTSLHLTPEKPFIFQNKFSLSFDTQFRQGDGYYGLICRVIGNKFTNMDLVSNTASTSANFWLVYKEHVLFSYSLSEIPNSDFGEWIKVNMNFDLKDNILRVDLNGIKKEKKVAELSDLKSFDIVFGACSNPKFQNTDVAPMTLKNVVLKDNNNKILREWELSKHSVNAVYDKIQKDKATVKNGTWLIDKHAKWSKIATLKPTELVGMAKNPSESLIYLIGKTKLYTYSVKNQLLDSIAYASGFPFNNYLNYFIYNPTNHKIISYDPSKSFLNEFDFDTKSWINKSFDYLEPDLAYHNSVISPLDSQVVIFGGYGHYMYKSSLMQFRPKFDDWKTQNFSNEIHPRYLSASGLDEKNNWLIFGGYGSKSGRQEVSPEFYYDLFSYDFNTSKFTKIRQYSSSETPFVPCEAIINLPKSNSFYTLIYNTSNFNSSFRLAEFNKNESKYVLFSDSIPYSFSDTESSNLFFLNQDSTKLITVTAHKNDVSIYTLAYPALALSDIEQKSHLFNSWIFWLLIGLGVIGMILIALKILKTNTSKSLLQNILHKFPASINTSQVNQETKSSLFFLGGFQMFDNDGNDISSQLTPTLKQLFIIIFLHTVKNGRGISTSKLNENLWFDKSEESARNNRNVSISRLRTILEKVGKIEIDQESSYLKIQMSDIYSDYIELTNLCNLFRTNSAAFDESKISHFVQLASRGILLPEFQIDWLDEFKAEFSNSVLDILFDFTNLPQIAKRPQSLNSIADCILKFDSINEEAIVLKCSTLNKLGKKGLAIMAYESFAKEYQLLLGTPYSVEFNEIISSTLTD